MYLTPKPHRRKKIKSPYESDSFPMLSYDHAYQLMIAEPCGRPYADRDPTQLGELA